ncbi:MAG: hypothetical protein JO291_05905 [Acidimicrobiia bacterium]|nr:hypothetical protein [Acidimicrobiia bacterium]
MVEHGHDHVHPHEHDAHPHLAEQRAQLGVSAMLDIGDGIGALVLLLPPQPDGTEIDICPTGRPEARFHTGVHPRQVGGRTFDTALYPSVPEGDYQVLDPELQPVADVTVSSGSVAQLDLRTT